MSGIYQKTEVKAMVEQRTGDNATAKQIKLKILIYFHEAPLGVIKLDALSRKTGKHSGVKFVEQLPIKEITVC